MADVVKEYKHNGLVVLWQSALCIHCKKCIEGLPSVFNLTQRPWIQLDKASEEEVIKQVSECPSGAISYSKE